MIKKPHPAKPVLLVDDEEHVLISFDTELRDAGFTNIITCNDAARVEALLAERPVSAVLLDLWMPNVHGEDILNLIAAEYPEIPVIVVTGLDQVETAVRCMKAGAFDYLVKPVEEGFLAAAVEKALAVNDLQTEVESLRRGMFAGKVRRPDVFERILTQNDEMTALFRYVEAVAAGSQPVLITGETGVGKELFARAVHAAGGGGGPFIAENAAGLDDAMFTDALFGHRKGAYTGADGDRSGMAEKAAGGVLFLDEIGDLSPASQLKLLRLIQEKEFHPLGDDRPRKFRARLIAATNRNLAELMEQGRFRKDLYYRLRTHQIQVPPLRRRPEDLPLLVDHFLEQAAADFKKKTPTPPPELFTLLAGYHFPGNVRELQAMVYDAVSRHQAGMLSMDVFKRCIHPGREDDADSFQSNEEAASLFASCNQLPSLNQAAELLVDEAMKRAEGNITQAAGMLGISRQALSKRLRRGMDSEDK